MVCIKQTTIEDVKRDRIGPVLNSLINQVDNIVKPTVEQLEDLLKKNGRVLAMRIEGVTIAHFFTNVIGKALVLECMLGKAIEGIDPCSILLEYAEREALRLNLQTIRIHTKRAGVVRKFLALGFQSVEFVIEKEIQ